MVREVGVEWHVWPGLCAFLRFTEQSCTICVKMKPDIQLVNQAQVLPTATLKYNNKIADLQKQSLWPENYTGRKRCS